MKIGTEDLIRFTQWESVATGFDRDGLNISKHIRPILDRIGVSEGTLGSEFERIAYIVFEDGGLTNYFAFFVFRPQNKGDITGMFRYQPGVTAYLSLLAPIGVFGRTERYLSRELAPRPYLEIENLLDSRDSLDPLANQVAEAISASEYRLLSPEDARQPLPAGIHPYEYCMCQEPWDRVFHVLFSNTD